MIRCDEGPPRRRDRYLNPSNGRRIHYFQENWHYPARIDDVWRVLAGIDTVSGRWKRGLYVAVAHDVYDRPEVGNAFAVRVRGFLPYELRLGFKITSLRRPEYIRLEITGDLEGYGELFLRAASTGTALISKEYVSINKRPLRTLEFCLNWLFALQHRWALARGQDAVMEYFRENRLLLKTDHLCLRSE